MVGRWFTCVNSPQPSCADPEFFSRGISWIFELAPGEQGGGSKAYFDVNLRHLNIPDNPPPLPPTTNRLENELFGSFVSRKATFDDKKDNSYC